VKFLCAANLFECPNTINKTIQHFLSLYLIHRQTSPYVRLRIKIRSFVSCAQKNPFLRHYGSLHSQQSEFSRRTVLPQDTCVCACVDHPKPLSHGPAVFFLLFRFHSCPGPGCITVFNTSYIVLHVRVFFIKSRRRHTFERL
jgi:hypothetical protein